MPADEPPFICTCDYACEGRTDDTDCPEHGRRDRAIGPPIVCAESSELRRKRLIDKLMTTAQEIQEMAQADMDPWADVMRDAADEIRMSERADDPPIVSDRFGAVFPDGAVYDATEGARLFDQDAEQRARSVAVKIGGRPCRIRTTIEWLPDA